MCFITSGRDGVIAGGIPAGVEVDGVSGAAAPTVAEHAMALLLAVGRQLPAITLTNQLRSWDRGMAAGLRSLEGQTMLVVGLGRIGGEVATRARAFGMRVVAVTRTPREHPAVDVTLPLPELTSALGLADSIVIAVAHTPQTHHLFGRREFVACKPSAVLVNVARGGVVNQPALAEALRDGRLAGAGLDVTDPEPLPPGDPLWDAPRLVISPHLASSGSLPSEQRLADVVGRRVASHCRRASESKWPENG
jgi:phosphoglycerate dehydrogenase-like enzyme